MIKVFILLLIFESGPNATDIQHIEFSSRQSCESAKTAIQAKAKQQGHTNEDGKKTGTLKLIESACLEK